MTNRLREIQTHWQIIGPFLTIRNDTEYDQAVEILNSLIDEVGTDEEHPLYDLLDTLGTLLQAYEETSMPISEISGVDVLRHLMEEHGLRQSDLPEIGSQGVVSEILSGRRSLNRRQIEALSLRFNVSPAVFF